MDVAVPKDTMLKWARYERDTGVKYCKFAPLLNSAK